MTPDISLTRRARHGRHAHQLLMTMISLGLLATSCASGAKPATPAPTATAVDDARAQRRQGLVEQLKAAMQPDVDPCQDFYTYACGGWDAANDVPEDQSRWMRSFNVISEANDEALRALLERPTPEGQTPARSTLFYQACMDEAFIAQQGASAAQTWLMAADQVKDLSGLLERVGHMHAAGLSGLFGLWVSPDAKEPTRYAAHLRQGGLGLPDRAFYLEERHAQTLEAYQGLITRLLTLAGQPPEAAKAQAAQVLALERDLATLSLPRAELRDPDKTYNKLTLSELEQRSGLPWRAYLERRGLAALPELIVQTPAFTQGLKATLQAHPVEAWQAYLRWHTLRELAPLMSEPFELAHFELYGQRLNGQRALKPRWKRCVRATDAALGFELGQRFVQERFAGQSKPIAQRMVKSISQAFEDNLNQVTWMDATTRERALAKLGTIDHKIGYPDVWRAYDGLTVQPQGFLQNTLGAWRHELERRTSRHGQPVDRDEWFMSPPTVNAYYSATTNQIVFPAGILQAPFFDQDLPMPVNFGGIGMVIGHEITHGFDDGGRKFDKDGRLTMWWQPEAITGFEERAACVERQYSAIEVQPGLRINGKLTLGENIADLGGLKIAHLGLLRWLKEHHEDASPVLGLSPEQLFFLGFAQTWCARTTPENEQQRLLTDSHSPPRMRVNQSVSNLPAFHAAFSCQAGAPMNPPDQCQVW